MTDVTIRGIDDETYSQFAAEAKKRGMPIGELTTAAMKAMISIPAETVYQIGNLDELSVSKSDLESLPGKVILSNIDLLQFDESVDWTALDKHVKEISNIDVLRIPSQLSKFQILTKSRNVDLIQEKK